MFFRIGSALGPTDMRHDAGYAVGEAPSNPDVLHQHGPTADNEQQLPSEVTGLVGLHESDVSTGLVSM